MGGSYIGWFGESPRGGDGNDQAVHDGANLTHVRVMIKPATLLGDLWADLSI
jgi:hypothetical protein